MSRLLSHTGQMMCEYSCFYIKALTLLAATRARVSWLSDTLTAVETRTLTKCVAFSA